MCIRDRQITSESRGEGAGDRRAAGRADLPTELFVICQNDAWARIGVEGPRHAVPPVGHSVRDAEG
eukprot:14539274-Alexandrium_andersonii.AAC.1